MIDNRGGDFYPFESHQTLIDKWAYLSRARTHAYCQDLLKMAANPTLLMIALEELGRNQLLGESGNAEFSSQIWAWLRDIQKRLLSGTFRRGPYRQVQIPKAGKTGFRTIEVPPDETRIVSRNLSNILSPMLDRDFYPLSIGFRPGRSPLHGLAALDLLLQRGLTYLVACDLQNAFGELPKKRALQILSSRIHASPVMRLVEEILDRHRKKGVPQGISISPLALNLFLDHQLDHWWVKNHGDTVLIRYADDILIACPSHESAVASYTALRDRIQTIGMKVKENKDEAIFDLVNGDVADFLGFRVRLNSCGGMQTSINDTSWDKLEIKLAETSYKQIEMCEPVLADQARSVGLGWLQQKAIAIDEAQLPSIVARVRDLGYLYDLDMTLLTDEEAHFGWTSGQDQWLRAKRQVLPWIPGQ